MRTPAIHACLILVASLLFCWGPVGHTAPAPQGPPQVVYSLLDAGTSGVFTGHYTLTSDSGTTKTLNIGTSSEGKVTSFSVGSTLYRAEPNNSYKEMGTSEPNVYAFVLVEPGVYRYTLKDSNGNQLDSGYATGPNLP